MTPLVRFASYLLSLCFQVRGQLILETDATREINLHANLINIKGGRLILGNATQPFTGPKFRLWVTPPALNHSSSNRGRTRIILSPLRLPLHGPTIQSINPLTN